MTLSVMTLSINVLLSFIMMSVIILSVIKQSVIMLIFFKQSVIKVNAIVPSVGMAHEVKLSIQCLVLF
jgi:hypothetical protein